MPCNTRASRFFACILFIVAQSALAILPENGWYWNESQSGRGFNIEIQNNLLFMSAFVYRPDGTPVWYVAGGAMSSPTQWTAALLQASQGQCLGCTYRAPQLTTVGTVSINFTSERTATISLPGETISVKRQDWSGLGNNTRDALLGEWSTTEGDPIFPVYGGDRISLSLPGSTSSGPYAGGWRTGSTSNVAAGIYDSTYDDFAILMDSSSSYYRLYLFRLNTFNRAEGQLWVYLKTDTPSGSGLYFVAHRTKSAALLQTGNGPGIGKSAWVDENQETTDRMIAEHQKSGAKAADDRITQLALGLRSALEERR